MNVRLAALSLALIASGGMAHAIGTARGYTAPPVNYASQWYTTPDGCSYSRAQAPGYAPTWHLILNPHHIGQPAPHRRCPPMLGGRS